jgi:hypothetical protein
VHKVRVGRQEIEKESNMTDEENPLQKYVDALDNQKDFVQPVITPALAQYVLKALDYLEITGASQPGLVEREHHDVAESIMIDIISYAPEDE